MIGVIYSLFLGFGISIGAEIYHTITGLTVVGASDYKCANTHNTGMWYQVTPSQWWCKSPSALIHQLIIRFPLLSWIRFFHVAP
jgi:hypothetical protein